MSTATPSIACLGVIGKNNNPLYQTSFPSSPAPSSTSTTSSTTPSASPSPTPLRTPLQFSLLLSSSLDLFEARARPTPTSSASAAPQTNLSGDLGLLTAVDERLSVYGAETNTGVKFVVILDMAGRREGGGGADGDEGEGRPRKVIGRGVTGVRDGEVKVVFRAMQASYVRLLQNPFYTPDEHSPATGRGGKPITSRKFAAEMRRIGESWRPGMTTI